MINVPKVSVIMPVYNTANYLSEAIESILNQTLTDYEFIIVDDCSNDGSLEIIKSYEDQRILLIENKINRGIAFSLNYGITIAKGQYLARMDSDDICHPSRLERQFNFLQNEPNVGILGTSINYIVKGTIQGHWAVEKSNELCKLQLLNHTPFAHPTVMFNLNKVSKDQIIYKQCKVPAEDYELWTRLCSKYKVSNLDEKLVDYRIHESQISSSKSHLLREKLSNSRINYISSQFPFLSINAIKNLVQVTNYSPNIFLRYKLYIELRYLKKALILNSKFNHLIIQEFHIQFITNFIFRSKFSRKMHNWISRLFGIHRRFVEIKSLPKNVTSIANIHYILGFNKVIKGRKTKIFGLKFQIQDKLILGVNGLHSLFNKNGTIIENEGNLRVLGFAEIGCGCKVFIGDGATLTLGDRTFITADTKILCHKEIIIGSNCAISWGVQIMDNDYHSIDGKPISRSISIGNNVWVGSNVTILKGAYIPDNCIIAANSVVTNSFDEKNILIAGNPAKIIKRNVDWKR
jgi:glycosyltransferase involved in cell wall biosynthesis/carbonic anhydrase/acetyltransferase-like protein (isoleucine patch superfamily)